MSGLTASILGISHALIYFPLYEHWKMYFKSKYEPNKDKLSNRYVFLSAIFSKSKRGTTSDDFHFSGIVSDSLPPRGPPCAPTGRQRLKIFAFARRDLSRHQEGGPHRSLQRLHDKPDEDPASLRYCLRSLRAFQLHFQPNY